MKKTVIVLMIITIVSQVTGFIRDLILAYYYGTSNISDVYLISITITGVFFGLIAKGISTSYIPVFTELENKKGRKQSELFTTNLINFLCLITIFLLIIGVIFTEKLVKVFAIGFSGETLDMAIYFTRVTFFTLILSSLLAVFKGYLNVRGKFTIPAMVALPLNFFVILFIILSSYIDEKLLAFGFLFGTMAQVIFVYVFSYKEGYRYSFYINYKDENLKKALFIAFPVILGTSIEQVNIIVDKTLASLITVGGISALNYAETLKGFVVAVFIAPVLTVMFPKISKMMINQNKKELTKTLASVIVGISFLVIPAITGLLILSKPIVIMLFGRGAFDNNAIEMTSNALAFYVVGIIGIALRDTFSYVFYSIKNSKTPMINAAIAIVINIILNIVLSPLLGIGGLALATSISAIVAALLLYINLQKQIGTFIQRKNILSIIKILISSAIMGLIISPLFKLLDNILTNNISVMISIFTGFVIYATFTYLFKISEVQQLVKDTREKLRF